MKKVPSKASVNLAVTVGALIAVGLFIAVPAYVAQFVLNALSLSGRIYTSLLELMLRMGILVGYISLVSRMKDIQRVLQYHGAEHQVIWAWEEHYSDPKLSRENWDRDGLSRFYRREPRNIRGFIPVAEPASCFSSPCVPGSCSFSCPRPT